MPVGLLGLSHKTADLALREAFARAASDVFGGQKALFFPHPTVLLSTCNRTEIYFSADDLGLAHSDVLARLGKFEHRVYSLFGVDCLAHLIRVAAGLDSAIIAESDIQRQVRIAYESAARALTAPMHFVFQKALKVSKAVRTRLLEGPSMAQAVWEMASADEQDLRKAKILFVGNSTTNREIAAVLTRRGAHDLCVITREPAHVPLGRALPRTELAHWREYDVVFAATQADGYLLTGPTTGRHVLFDFSVPRVIDPVLSSSEGVRLYNIEEIQRWMAGSPQDLAELEQFVWHEAVALTRRYRARLASSKSSLILKS